MFNLGANKRQVGTFGRNSPKYRKQEKNQKSMTSIAIDFVQGKNNELNEGQDTEWEKIFTNSTADSDSCLENIK